MKAERWSRIPTPAEIEAFDGAHCSWKYRHAIRIGWRCPCCNRTPQELIRWSTIQHGKFGMGWTISLVLHHCHGPGRFEETVICGDCNSADSAAKRKLGLPGNFSFSPREIAQFVKCAPHTGKTEIDYGKAQEIFAASAAKS